MHRELYGPVAYVRYSGRGIQQAVVIKVETGVYEHVANWQHAPDGAADRHCPFVMIDSPISRYDRERGDVPSLRPIVEDERLNRQLIDAIVGHARPMVLIASPSVADKDPGQ